MFLPKLTKRTHLLNIIAFISLVASLGMIFFYAPNESTMGHVQRVFYFHVGAGWVASVSFFVALVCGGLYLWRPKPVFDAISLASVEIGVVFIMINVVSGSVWGKPAWNTWWLWSPRLTSITILWLVYIAYFMLRGALDDVSKKRRFAAVYVIAAFVTVIVTYGSIRILRDIHPVVFAPDVALESAQGSAEGLQEFSGVDSLRMVITLNVSVLSFSILYLAWLANRLRLEAMKNMTQVAKMRLIAKFMEEG